MDFERIIKCNLGNAPIVDATFWTYTFHLTIVASEYKMILIENADEYWCQLYEYRISHKVMYVRLNHKKHNREWFYLYFSGVVYYSGPTVWDGANFRVVPPKDCLSFSRELGCFEHIPDKLILNTFQLYLVEKPSFSVTIIASSVTRGGEPPQ
jgi:hypothetical protein